MTVMDELATAKFEARLMLARRVGQVRAEERNRAADRIEQMLYQAKSTEVAEALVSLARFIIEGAKA